MAAEAGWRVLESCRCYEALIYLTGPLLVKVLPGGAGVDTQGRNHHQSPHHEPCAVRPMALWARATAGQIVRPQREEEAVSGAMAVARWPVVLPSDPARDARAYVSLGPARVWRLATVPPSRSLPYD